MKYRPEIDGLRALAIIPVMLFHAGFSTFSGGFVGVDVFFVISGYLITSIILAQMKAGTFRLADFYERRARRILPALCVVAFACIPFAWLMLLPDDMTRFSESLGAVFVFVSNFYFWQTSGYFEAAAESKPLLHTWSLAVEEQYYLAFPLFLLLMWRFGKYWILGAISAAAFLSFSIAQWLSQNDPGAAFFLLPARAWELMLGALLCFRESDPRQTFRNQAGGIAGLLMIAYSVFAFDKHTPSSISMYLLPTFGTALVIRYAKQPTVAGKLLGYDCLVRIGLISYAAYLWHQPLLAFARYAAIAEPGKALSAALVVTTLALAHLTWKYVETPIRTRRWLRSGQLVFTGMTCAGFFVVFGMAGHLSNGYSNRFNETVLATLRATPVPIGQRRNCASDVGAYVAISDKCALGEKKTVLTGALLGDSMADSLSRELDKASSEKRLSFLNMSFVSCPPVPGLYRVDLGENHKCPQGNDETYSYLSGNKNIDTVILYAHWTAWLEGSNFDNGEGGVWVNDSWVDVVENHEKKKTRDKARRKALVAQKYTEGISGLIKTGKKIVLIYPVPEVGWNARIRMAERLLMKEHLPSPIAGDAGFSTSHQLYKTRNEAAISILDGLGQHSNLIRVYPERLLCNTYVPERCAFSANGASLYTDAFHLSDAGARMLIAEIMRQIAP